MKKFLITVLVFIGAFCACLALPACACNKKDPVEKTKAEVSLTDREITVFVGGTYQFSPRGAEKFNYSSSDEAIASVTESGVLTGKADGTAFVTVSADESEVICRVNVIKAENYIRLNVNSATAFVGGEVTIKAEVVKNGEITDEKITFGTNYDGVKIKENGENSVAVTCEEVGYYEITASKGNLSAKCVIKSVSLTATALETPVLSVEECKTLKWAAVENATGYEYCVNGGEWTKTDKTEVDIKSVTDELKYGDKALFSVKATADNDFDYIDGLTATIEFSHDYALTALGEYSCTKAGKVKFDCTVCEKSYTDDNYIADHKFVDGWCEVCHTQLTPKVLYRYDELNDCYFVVSPDAGYNSEDLYILAKYNDGVNGERPVKYFGHAAFQANLTVKRVFLPESMTEFVDKNDLYNTMTVDGKRVSSPLRGLVFEGCVNLEFVSMRGITTLRDIANQVTADADGNFVHIGVPSAADKEKGYTLQSISFAHWNFRDCYNLKTVIVGNGFNNYGSTFMFWVKTPKDNVPKADLFVYGDEIKGYCNDSYPLTPTLTGVGNNALLTGDVFYYDENSTDCYKWHFAEDGTVITSGKHEYNAKNVCKKCGAYNDYGVKYGYDAKSEVYYVSDNSDTIQTEITVIAEYNDGKNGVHPVEYVKNGAFRTNGSIRRVTLPASVKRLEGCVFQMCGKLEFVSMVGVESLPVYAIEGGIYKSKVDTGNNFLDCYKLTTVIVGKNFEVSAQQFLGRPIGTTAATPSVDLYCAESAEESKINAAPNAQNNLLTGVVYYKGELDTCRRWTDEDGDIETSARDHNYVDGVCDNCGEYETYGLTFGYNETAGEDGAYFVTGYTGSEETLTVIGTYNDGIHGVKKVAYIARNAFNGNKTIKKVILHENINSLEGSVFLGCTNLEYVSMIGITDLNYASPYGGAGRDNNFRNCFKLKTVVTSTALKTNVGQFGSREEEEPANKILDFFVFGESGAPDLFTGRADANNLVSGRVYYYSATQAENCWHYDENGFAVLW